MRLYLLRRCIAWECHYQTAKRIIGEIIAQWTLSRAISSIRDSRPFDLAAPSESSPIPRWSPVYNAGQLLSFTGVPWNGAAQTNQRAAAQRASLLTFISGCRLRFFSAAFCC